MASVGKIIRKGSSNKKEYLLHTLKNGMKCLLISQPSCECDTATTVMPESKRTSDTNKNDDTLTDDESYLSDKEESESKTSVFGMSLSVHIGSFNDPVEAQGLAHLLEHIISNGRECSSVDNHCNRFINRESGFLNAETGCEHTNYYFDTCMEHSKETLDVFSDMLQAPKFTKELIAKEKQIVDSEFQMVHTKDDCRLQRLLSNCANKENPAKLFKWGNLKSLNHKNFKKMVQDFQKNYYSASRMTMAVQSKESVYQMVEWIDKLFSKIPTDQRSAPKFKNIQEPFCLNKFHNIFKVVSTNSIKKISFFWYLPPVIKLYKFKPIKYISWIINHEGKGTLISYLRKLNYATEIETDVNNDFNINSIYTIFPITIELTDLGYNNLNKIIELTFGYLNLIREKGISENIFKGIQISAENEFNFAENQAAIDHVKDLSENMLIYDAEDYLSGPILFYEYSPEIIAQFLNLLTANRVAIFILSKEFEFDNSDKFTTDDIFGTMYLTKSITEEQENGWSAIKPHPFFKIPGENLFLTTQFLILPQSSDRKYPEKIFQNDYFELWHKQDSQFKMPKSFVMLNFITNLPSKSLENFVLYDLFFNTVQFLLNEETYPATTALYSYDVQLFYKGFELTFKGFNEKLPLLIDIVIKCIKNYKSLVNEEIFFIIKTKCINKYKNKQYDVNYISSDLQNSIIYVPDWCLEKRLNCLENLEYKQILNFYDQLNTFYSQVLTQGNITETQAIEIAQRVVNILNYNPLAKECFPVSFIKRLDPGDYRIKMANYNPNDNNSMVYKYYQFEKSTIKDSVKYLVLQSLIEQPAFDELRSKQCLGYDVQLEVTDDMQHYGFTFKVTHQKHKFETSYVLNRMNLFLTEYWKQFYYTDEFNEVRESMISYNRAPDDSLAQEFNRNKNEIISERFQFNRLELEIEALKILKYEDVRNLKDGFLNGRTLSIEIVGNDDENNCNKNSPTIKRMCFEENTNCTYIQNIDEFKRNLKHF